MKAIRCATYFLTDKGKALGPVLKALYTWGERYGWAPRAPVRSSIPFREHKVSNSDSHRVFVAPRVAALGH